MTEAARILLVEDDPQDVELMLRALRHENVQGRIEVARDGEEALDYLFRRGAYEHRVTGEAPALVLLDLKLPKIGGLQVLREVKSSAECQSIPVVILTSSGEQRDVMESYRLGVNGYIQKPVDIAEFRKAIRALASYWLEVNLSPSFHRPRISPGVRS
ncbi:MAG TPA: response regulator [Bryobacteraceae bacterium]|jgi:DNA-binding response OmpR family regulator|nr:response regulator [Bryobacteraceae bacterium]